LAASNPVRTPEEESLRQKFLRKRLFALAKRGAVDFDKLYAEVVPISDFTQCELQMVKVTQP
jgi:hypothetical protein